MQPFTVALCQVEARELERSEESLAEILEALDEAGRLGAHLVALPECSWPAYYLRDADPWARAGVRPYAEVEALLAARAREHGYWLAAGLAVPGENGALPTNSGVVFDPRGNVAGRYDKTFLWHFDRNWFAPGGRFPVFDAGFCRFGILICADGRQPEIARSLALNGAEVILDLTAWVSSGRTVAELSTVQCEYMMPARAYENGVWVAAADKWGTEDGAIVYAGRSIVIDPDGQARNAAPSDCSTVLTYEITPMPVERVPRRPSLYGTLVRATDQLPVTALLDQPLAPSQSERRVAVVPGNGALDIDAMLATYELQRDQAVDLVVLAGSHGPEGWQVELPKLETCLRERGGALAFAVETDGCAAARSALLLTADRTVEHVATHGRGPQLGETPCPVVPTDAGNVGLLCDEEGEVPEVARALALEGADILAWSLFEPREMTERLARTRSDENRVYTAAAWPGGGMNVAPGGAPMSIVPQGTGVAMADMVNLGLARSKTRAPGTNVILDRMPGAYGALTRGD